MFITARMASIGRGKDFSWDSDKDTFIMRFNLSRLDYMIEGNENEDTQLSIGHTPWRVHPDDVNKIRKAMELCTDMDG